VAWLPPLPPLPPLGHDFPETNVRTYVRTPSGRSAVWFFSLEVDNAALAAGARTALGLPSRLASMQADVGPGRCTYRSVRRDGSRTGHHLEVRPGDRLAPGQTPEHVHLLTARWRAVVPRGGLTITVPVRHQPWELHAAEADVVEEDLVEAAGLPAPAGSPHVLWSPGVDADLGLPRPG
jgi:uncharacterized protein YqjF (DUF2071 family)